MANAALINKGSLQDFYGQNAAPASPPVGQARAYYNSTTDLFHVIDSNGNDIIVSSSVANFSDVGAGTNTNALVIGTGGSLTVSGSGTINATSLGGTAASSYALLNSPSFTTPALGTPASGNLANCTALPAAQVTAGTMQANMIFVTPALGTPSSGNLNSCVFGVASSVAGVITLEGSTSGTCSFTAPATAGTVANPIVCSNSFTVNGGLFVGVSGVLSGVITLKGSTSNSCSITAPAVAGTVTNPILFSNSINLASTCVYQSNGTAGITAGNFTAVTSINSTAGLITTLSGTSDARLKNVIAPLAGGLDAINAITPVKYRWNAKGVAQTGLSGDQVFIGFIAQDVQAAVPEAITATEASKSSDETFLCLDDKSLIATLVLAVKELSAEVDRLKAR